jgi:hypothetical protein
MILSMSQALWVGERGETAAKGRCPARAAGGGQRPGAAACMQAANGGPLCRRGVSRLRHRASAAGHDELAQGQHQQCAPMCDAQYRVSEMTAAFASTLSQLGHPVHTAGFTNAGR